MSAQPLPQPPAYSKAAARLGTVKTGVLKNDYLTHGKYSLVILNISETKTTKKGDVHVVTYRVVEAEALPGEGKPTPVGTTCSAAWPVDEAFDQWGYHRKAARQFFLALTGRKEVEKAATPEEVLAFDDLLSRDVQVLGSKAQPARGMLINCETREKTTKMDKTITKTYFAHVKQTAEEVAARCAELGSAE